MIPDPADPLRSSPRQRFRRRRARIVAATGAVMAVLAAVGALFLAPGDPSALRWGGVSLGWWATLAALVLEAGAMVVGGPGSRDREDAGAR